jgi:beta-glucosidase
VRAREELEGFRRVTLDPGQTKTVMIPLKASQLAFWDVGTHAFHVLQEPVRLMIGDSSADIALSATEQVQ